MINMQGKIENSGRMIAASEISQYEFCNVAWEMEREGVPHSNQSSRRMREGISGHQARGRRFRLVRAVSILLVALLFSLFAITVLMLLGFV